MAQSPQAAKSTMAGRAALPRLQPTRPENDTSRERLLLLPVFGCFALCAVVLLLALCDKGDDRGSEPQHETEELMPSHLEVEQHAASCLQRRACCPVHI